MIFCGRWREAGAAGLLAVVAAGCEPGAPDERPEADAPAAFSVPGVPGFSELEGEGLRVEAFNLRGPEPSSADDLRAKAWWGWTPEGLLCRVQVADDQASEARAEEGIYQGDGIELFVSQGERELYQWMVAPGRDPEASEMRTKASRNRSSLEAGLDARIERRLRPDGYEIDILVPWSSFPQPPREGDTLGVQLYVNDLDRGPDGAGRVANHMWYPLHGASADSARMHRVVLGREAGEPVRLAASVAVNDARQMVITVSGAPDLAGRSVALRSRRRDLQKGTLSPEVPLARFEMPLPRPGAKGLDFMVVVPGERPLRLVMPDLEAAYRQALARIEFQVGAVFSGDRFPAPRLREPRLAEELIGLNEIRTAYYDAQRRPVGKPSEFGRYGALVELVGPDGVALTREITLFREPPGVDWRARARAFGVRLISPEALGIPPSLAKTEAPVAEAYAADALGRWMREDDRFAVLLAALADIERQPDKFGGMDPVTIDQEWWYELRRQRGDAPQYEYLVQLPPDYEAEPGRRWPLLLFLHGAGERGNDLQRVRVHGPLREADRGRKLPFVIVAPQCPSEERWSPVRLNALLEEVQSRYRIDPDRIYLTGLSMGGFGSWALAARYPEKFAAVVPICGGGVPSYAPRLKNLPIWAFHGDQDRIVPLERSEEMVQALKELGAPVRLVVYPGVDHDSWTETYANPELYAWLLEHTRRK